MLIGGGSIGGLITFLYFRRLENLKKQAEVDKTNSEHRKVEFDIYDGSLDNWKDLFKNQKEDIIELKKDMQIVKSENVELKKQVGEMERNYLIKIGELEKEQQENKKLKTEVGTLRHQVGNLSTRLSKYESLPKDENNNTIDI